MPALVQIVSLLALLAFAGTAQAASQRDHDDCRQHADASRQIAACTRIIGDASEPRRNRAIAHANRGDVHFRKGDFDRAVAEYSAAIRLDPEYASAYNNRGNAYRGMGDLDFDRASADFTKAIRLSPTSSEPYWNLALVHFTKGEFDRALAYADEATRLGPNDVRNHVGRGMVRLYAADLAGAEADLLQARKLAPDDLYILLWLDIVVRRDHRAGLLPAAAPRLDLRAWPGPVVNLFAGATTQAAVLAAAEAEPDAGWKLRKVCEANFFAGVLALLQGRQGQAVGLLRAVATGCPRNMGEWAAAGLELKGLGVQSPSPYWTRVPLPSSCLSDRTAVAGSDSRLLGADSNGPSPFRNLCR